MVADHVERNEQFRFLEVGGAWAGFKSTSRADRDIAGLSHRFAGHLGKRLHLHFTNLTPWHCSLPLGVTEHPFVTGASLSVVGSQGCFPGTVDVIYSQAAVYFEPDINKFVSNAEALLKPGGLLIFNHPEGAGGLLAGSTLELGLALKNKIELGGMNGIVVAYEKAGRRGAAEKNMAFKTDEASQAEPLCMERDLAQASSAARSAAA
jgi:SAM-dependent methyltransferase